MLSSEDTEVIDLCRKIWRSPALVVGLTEEDAADVLALLDIIEDYLSTGEEA